jgi:hypothetical protein
LFKFLVAAVGAALTEAYWKPGNSSQFLDLVQGLTGKPLTGAAWIESLQASDSSSTLNEAHETPSLPLL